MNNLEKAALAKVISMLNACKLQYAIVDSDGTKHGDLEVVIRKKRAPLKYPMGTLSGHFKPYIENLLPDQAAEIPAKNFNLEDLRGSIAAWASTNWGNGTCTTLVDKQTNCVLVFRTSAQQLPF